MDVIITKAQAKELGQRFYFTGKPYGRKLEKLISELAEPAYA